ncbi:MAG: CotH kinase family protein [Ruminococcus sp.]|nr:CotH kinase family protein [Ruminococcus sp.]
MLSAALAGLAALVLWLWLAHPDIYINEIAPSNEGKNKNASLTDINGDTCDWVELYNPSDKEQTLDGFYLVKNGSDKYSLDGVKIPAEGYIVIYCSKSGFKDDFEGVHADFNISKTGEDTISLYYRNESICDVKLPQLDRYMTYSRAEDGTYYVSEPTPAEKNSEITVGDTVKLSKQGGYYEKEFELKLTASKGQTIYYTLDGTDPKTSSTRQKYTSPLSIKDRNGEKNVLSAFDPMQVTLNYDPENVSVPKSMDVDKATVIRACAVGSSGKAGRTVTATYFVGTSSKKHHDLPIVSVVTDPESLYNYDTGIYMLGKVYDDYVAEHPNAPRNGSVPANYNQRGREWERPCHIEFYSADGDTILSQDCGIRTQGGWSRSDYQKSFRFFARSSYGSDSFDAELWEDSKDYEGKTVDKYSTFVLRNGGNDCNYSKFKDPMLQSMVSERLPDTQATSACVLFIDGEYWGLYTLTQDMSAEYFSEKYDVPKDEVICVRSSSLDEGREEDMLLYEDMLAFVTNNSMSDEENYKKACELIDMDNFIEYCAAEMYFFNTDWPQNNFGCWRTREVDDSNPAADGRWRFYMFDTESSCSHYTDKHEQKSIFTYLREHDDEGIGGIICSLIENKDFQMKLTTSIMKLANMNYSHDNFTNTLEQYMSVYYKELDNYFKRFPTWANVSNATEPMLARMDTFFSFRQMNITRALEEEFSLGEQVKLSLAAEGKGVLYIDATPVGGALEQTYYQGCELTVKAVPQKGWKFDHWEGSDSKSDEAELTLDNSTSLKAVFKK